MGKELKLLVEWCGTQGNRHLADALAFFKSRSVTCHVVAFSEASQSNPGGLPALDECARLGISVEWSSGQHLPGDLDGYFPHPDGNPSLVQECLIRGVKVFQASVEHYPLAHLVDFHQGYVLNPEADWYAKVFPQPVHIAHPEKLDLALGVTINPRSIILNSGPEEQGSIVSIGRATHIGSDALLNLGAADFRVGNFTMISANFAAHAARHTLSHISSFAITKGPFKFFGALYDQVEPISVGHDVWIGEGVKCLPGVQVPNGAVVGAASVVTHSLEPYGIYAGNPARFIRYRFEKDKIAFLNECGWWDLEFARLREIRRNFCVDITGLPIEELKALF